MSSGKSLAIAYAMKKKKSPEEDGEEMVESKEESPRAQHRDMYAQGQANAMDKESKRERAIRMFKGEDLKESLPAKKEDSRMLGQHGEEEEGPDGPFVDAEDPKHSVSHDVENQDEVEDMVGRVMKQRQQMFAKGGEAHMCSGGNCSHYSHGGAVKMSEGGEIANSDLPIVDDMPAEFDDLHLRDDLESSYTGKDSGDELGNSQLEEDEGDLISRIMKSRAKKDRMPRPA